MCKREVLGFYFESGSYFVRKLDNFADIYVKLIIVVRKKLNKT